MFSVNNDWNPKQAKLKSIILKPESFDEAAGLSLELHALVHMGDVSLSQSVTFADEIFSNVNEACFRDTVYSKGRTYAYNIWHITRIEDICANILIADDDQVMNTDHWIEKINCGITDTGNALTPEEISEFSQKIDREQLFAYRAAVGRKTRKILKQLKPGDMKRKMRPESLKRVVSEKAVSTKKNAVWLIDFWGNKNIAGLIQMPLTRHQILHLNDCLKIKKKCK